MVYICDWMDDYRRVCEQEFDNVLDYLDHLAEHHRQVPPSMEVPC